MEIVLILAPVTLLRAGKYASLVIFHVKLALIMPSNALHALMATLNQETIVLEVVNLEHFSILGALHV